MFNKQITKIIKICLQNYSMRFDPILTKRFLCLCFVWKCKNGNKKRWIISMFCYADTHTRAYTCACKRYVWIPIIQLFNWIMYLKVFIHWFLIILKESIKFGHFFCVWISWNNLVELFRFEILWIKWAVNLNDKWATEST